MYLSLRYYVLLLGSSTSRLFEGERETLVAIDDARFPFDSPSKNSAGGVPDQGNARQITFLLRTDQRFSYYFRQRSRFLILVGEKRQLHRFEMVTARPEMILGKVEGDFSALSLAGLGNLVWPVVKSALAGEKTSHLQELSDADVSTVSFGMKAVEQSLRREGGSSLFVDEDFRSPSTHLPGLPTLPASHLLGSRDLIEDAVDIVIERVLARGGNVFFLDTDSMMPFKRIALIA